MTKKIPRGLSGKFITQPKRTAQDILALAQRVSDSFCLQPPANPPFGDIVKSTGAWRVLIGKYDAQGKRLRKMAHEVVYQHFHPAAFIGARNTYKLKKLCNTRGCLNHTHYDIVNGKGISTGEDYMNQAELITLLDAIRYADQDISFADSSEAESFRMYVYRVKRGWKKNRPDLYEKYEDVVIKKNKLHPNILDFTIRGRAFADVLAQIKDGNKPQEPAPEIDLSIAIDLPDNFDAVTGEPAVDPLEELGFTSKPKDNDDSDGK